MGRDRELATIEAAAFGARRGVVLAGDAGVGKTALSRAAMDRLAAAGRHTDWVIATRAGAAIPFGAVAHLLTRPWPSRPLDVIRSLSAWAEGGGGRAAVVLAVDDAHLLDDGSAAAIAHLARQQPAFVLVTVAGTWQ